MSDIYRNGFTARMRAGQDAAALRRHRGEASGCHASWNDQAKARRQANAEAGPCGDNFDQWLAEVKGRVADIMEQARLGFIRASENLDEIPF